VDFVQNTTNRSVVIQGGQITFQAVLLQCEGGTPLDPDGYPMTQTEPLVNVYDPDGSVVAIGVGNRISQGVYNYLFTCPIGAIISNGWSITWSATLQGEYYSWTEYFQVVDRTLAQPKPSDPNQLSSLKTEEYVLALTGRTERVFLNTQIGTTPVQPVATPTLSVYTPTEQLLATLPASGVTGVTGSYYADVPGTLISQTDTYYMLVWSYQLTPTTPFRTNIQTLWTAPLSVFKALPDLRMLLDKCQKPTDRVQGYADQELARYLIMGLGLFNAKPPVTYFTWPNLPPNVYPWAMQCSMLYALKAQMLLEIDQDFEMSGQTITLRYEHFQNLSSLAQQAATEWNEQGEKVKVGLGLARGTLLIRPVVQGYISLAQQTMMAGSFLSSYKI
jgi:hypothetical protein